MWGLLWKSYHFIKMVQLLKPLNEKEREKLLTVTGSTPRLKLGVSMYHRNLKKQIIKLINRAEIVRWVAESKRPFTIVNDRGFQSLMKTGRPDYHIPSEHTVSRDVKQAFVHARKRVAKMLQEYEGQLNFATDAWTSPNHKAFVAFTVHFAHEGTPISMLLDLVEVAMSHSGVNLAAAFVKVLEDFGISDKVWPNLHFK